MYRARIAQYEQCILIGLDNKEKRETNVFQGEGRNSSWLWPVKINVFGLKEIIYENISLDLPPPRKEQVNPIQSIDKTGHHFKFYPKACSKVYTKRTKKMKLSTIW